MFSSMGLFKQVQCPEQSHCSLSKCIFSHHEPLEKILLDDKEPKPPTSVNEICGNATGSFGGVVEDLKPSRSIRNELHGETDEQDKPRKRLRLSNDVDECTETQAVVSNGPRRQPLAINQARSKTQSPRPPATAIKEASPPPSRASERLASYQMLKAEKASNLNPLTETKPNHHVNSTKNSIEVSLNPRMINNPPASHAIRMQLTTMLHEQMVRLNEEVCQIQGLNQSTLRLSPQELILEALKEEENVAKQNPTVYLNIIKLRITRLKKMKLAEWKGEREKQIAKLSTVVAPARPKTDQIIETGLSISQEIAFLSKLLADQPPLARFGYVTSAPSNEEVAKARDGVEAGQGWEQCDRCRIRFQIFPGRREEDGALTSGGTCSYHPAKPRRPTAKDKADKGHNDVMYACCNEIVGSSIGCTTAMSHVFKVSDPKRLALIMPFEKTPPKLLSPGPSIAVCFDCEMGYTTMGLELIRLTATSWPDGEELLDVLVRPLGEILDLNSHFSGVWPNDYTSALPYASGAVVDENHPDKSVETRLRLVESPIVARGLLFDLLTPETPLIGHALDNDLNSTRIIHPSIVDSVLLYPHPRGLPIRFGLKMLMKRHLDRDIQMGGANGHDSKEDARAAGDLVRLKVAEMWKAMQRDGWTVRKGEFCPPLPSTPTVRDPFGPYGSNVNI